MVTPYDWQEGIGHRAQYVEGRLSQGAPVLAASLPEGILLLTFRRQTPKVYEIYDRLVFGAVGQQSDVEAMRVAALEFAHQEGYNRSDQDVTIRRVVTALSGSVKRAFSDFNTSPLVARSLFAEVNATPEEDTFYVLNFDGDYSVQRSLCVVAGSVEAEASALERLHSADLGTLDSAIEAMASVWEAVASAEGREGLVREVALLVRSDAREERFVHLEGAA